jgi:transposase-like protein
VINVDCASGLRQRDRRVEADRGTRSTLSLPDGTHLNNIIEQDHRFIKKRITASLGFRSVQVACRTIESYEAMHAIR